MEPRPGEQNKNPMKKAVALTHSCPVLMGGVEIAAVTPKHPNKRKFEEQPKQLHKPLW